MCVSVGVSAGGREKKRVQKNGVIGLKWYKYLAKLARTFVICSAEESDAFNA